MTRFAFIAVVILIASPCLATKTISYQATVVEVVDGDSITISRKELGGRSLRPTGPVELDGIDAPEVGQPGGQEAKLFLQNLLKGRKVAIIELTDQGRSRGAWVFVGGKENDGNQTSVNVLMIEKGLAWHTSPNAHHAVSKGKPKEARRQMLDAQRVAKAKRTGIWASDNPTPPWVWRERQDPTAANKELKATAGPSP